MKDPLLKNKILAAVVVALAGAWIADTIAANVVKAPDMKKSAYAVDMSTIGQTATADAASAKDAAPAGPPPIAPLLASASADAGAKVAKVCAACHSFGKGEAAKIGPNLYGIVGAKHAHMAGYTYSAAMTAQSDKVWTYEMLNEFIYKPSANVAGTKMPYAGMKSDTDRANLIAWLRAQADTPEPMPKP